MKKLNSILTLIIAIISSANAYAISYEVIGPCSAEPVFKGTTLPLDLKQSVGKISVSIFDQQKIPYLGTEAGFNSILGTPTGEASIEILSDKKMRAHGFGHHLNRQCVHPFISQVVEPLRRALRGRFRPARAARLLRFDLPVPGNEPGERVA